MGTPPEDLEGQGRARISVLPNGPLLLRGRLEPLTPKGEHARFETQLALCRCGHSMSPPLCDGGHQRAGFRDSGELPLPDDERRVSIKPRAAGPLKIAGSFDLEGANGVRIPSTDMALCRCGASSRKPFCDGAHKKVGFESGA